MRPDLVTFNVADETVPITFADNSALVEEEAMFAKVLSDMRSDAVNLSSLGVEQASLGSDLTGFFREGSPETYDFLSSGGRPA